MNYFQADNLSKAYAEKLLFENISFGIDQGQKVGLIARNGAGKTTLLNIMMQKDIPDSGSCNFRKGLRIAYLDQNPVFAPEPTVIQTILNDDSPVISTLREYEKQVRLQEQDPQKADTEYLQKLMGKMDELQAWNMEAKIRQILSQLKIDDFDQPVGELSGGQIKRVALAKILVEEADFIILDEPTNHLDLQMIEWLEEYLAKQKLTILMVTHDRYFLDNVCNEILELEHGNIYHYKGNYAYFLDKKQEREADLQIRTEKARNLLKKETEWMRRQPKARTTKSKARITAFHELKETASGQSTNQPGEIIMQSARMGKKILELENVSKQFDEKVIIDNFSYIFKKKEKAGIVGMNGSGKTTLLNIITQKLKPDTGKVSIGETVEFGYYTQEGIKVDESKRVIDVIKDIAESIKVGKDVTMSASQFLQYFNFPHSSQNDLVRKLSGGERRRLHLLTILMKNPNFLILDEPTNDLDIATLNVLEDFLENFPGCLIVVSHDRYFLDNLVDHVFVFEGDGKIKDFPGNYTEYQDKKAEEKQQIKKTGKVAAPKIEIAKPKEKTKLTFKELKEFDELEKAIGELEVRKKETIDKMNSGKLSPDELQKISAFYEQIEKDLHEKENRWLELSQWV
ncbi:MAG: ABC transporter ATP-binding protein [Bacteroidetes bacterium]|nr:MAG: ABC transporter ATP-binding protein [Bacteroidota bacterium]